MTLEPTETLCMCKDRAAKDCPGNWQPGCDLGANAAHVEVFAQTPEEREELDKILGLYHSDGKQ